MLENEEHYRNLVDNSLDLICTHDLNGLLLTVNLAAARTLGYEPREIVNRNLREFLSPNSREEFELFLAAISEKRTAAGFLRLQTKNGETRIWSYTSTLQTEGAPVPFVRGVAHDFTEILQAQKALRESEERLRVAAEVGRMYAWEWDPATDSVLRSAECSGILGLSEAAREGVAKDYLSLIHPDDRAGLWSLVHSLTPEDPVYRTQYRRYRPDRSQLWLEESGRATFDKHGKMVRLVGMTADITERKLAEEALRRKDSELAEAQRLARMASWQWDPETDMVTWSEELYRISGLDPNLPAASFKEHPKFYTVESWERLRHAVEESLRTGKPYELDVEMVRPDGTTVWLFARGEAHRDTTGRIVQLRGTVQDITERRRAQEVLLSMSGRLITAQEEERTRIARELHDDLSQRMALLQIGLSQFEQNAVGLSLNDRRKLQHIAEVAREVSSSIHHLSHQLHPSKLDTLGLVAALGGLCKEFSDQHNVQVQFVHADIPRQISKDVTLCLFRIVQEALRNVVKHSGAAEAKVELSCLNDRFELCISDSGAGFNPATAEAAGCLGLISMRERIRLVGGDLSIQSEASQGTRIRVRVSPRATNPEGSTEGKMYKAGA